MALALAYQQRKPNLGDLSPEQVTAMQAPTQQPTMSLLDRISETGAGIGKGLANTVESMGQMVTAPIETGKEMYRNVSDIVSNPSLIADALKQMGEKATSSPAGFGEVVGENINPRNLARTLAKGLAKPVMQELKAAHGSPHRFPPTANNPLGEFDASKIGTGEGAQAYGHGFYLAENPEVAKDYTFLERNWFDTDKAKYNGKTINQHYEAAQRDQERGWRTKNVALEKDANAKLAFWENIMTHNHPEQVVSNALKDPSDWPELSAYVKKIDQSKFEGIPSAGSLYTVDLPDEKIAQMLDYDKPINEQSKYVKDALEAAGINSQSSALAGPMAKGQESHLQKHGIPGIKYFDAGSRDAKQGTRNFVVFPGEEKHLKILERK